MISRPRAVRLSLSASRAALCVAALFAIAAADAGAAPPSSGDSALIETAAHVNRTPKQSWPGYGVYLGNGLVLTASHVPGPFAQFQPHVVVGGQDFPTSLVKEGTLETVDLTILRFDPSKLPMRLRLRRTPLCERGPETGEPVVVATPEAVARSRILPPEAIPPEFRARFGGSTIPDVATTGNSGSGVFDAWRQCLLGVMSSQIHDRSQERAAPESRHREIFRARAGDPGVPSARRDVLARIYGGGGLAPSQPRSSRQASEIRLQFPLDRVVARPGRQEPGVVDAELHIRGQAPIDAEFERESVAGDRRAGDREWRERLAGEGQRRSRRGAAVDVLPADHAVKAQRRSR